MTVPAEWWKTTATFSGTIAGHWTRFEAGGYIFGDKEAAVWRTGDMWDYVARDGSTGTERERARASKLATGIAVPRDRCHACGHEP